MKQILLHKLLLSLLLASSFHATRLTNPTMLAVLASGQADAISTVALMPHNGFDQNILYRPFANNPATAMISMFAYDYLATRLTLHFTRRHPKIRALILGTLVADHTLGTMHNIRNCHGFTGL